MKMITTEVKSEKITTMVKTLKIVKNKNNKKSKSNQLFFNYNSYIIKL